MENINHIFEFNSSPEEKTQESFKQSTYSHLAENTLKIIAYIILALGGIITIAIITISCIQLNFWIGIGWAIGTLLSSITTWALLNILSNISINLFKIRNALYSIQRKEKENVEEDS